jgi:hypothetical protein
MGKRLRWQAVGFFAAPLVGAVLVGHGASLPLPACPLRYLTGIPCPTCGMTRSFVALAQGDLAGAVDYHLFGPILFVGLMIALGHVLLELGTGRQVKGFHTWLFTRPPLIWLTGLAFVGYYGVRLLQLSQTDELLAAFTQSPLAAFIHHHV